MPTAPGEQEGNTQTMPDLSNTQFRIRTIPGLPLINTRSWQGKKYWAKPGRCCLLQHRTSATYKTEMLLKLYSCKYTSFTQECFQRD